MSNYLAKMLITATAVAIVCGCLWYLQQGWIPEDPARIRVDPRLEQQVYSLLEQTKTASHTRSLEIFSELQSLGPTATPVLVKALHDDSPHVRAFAANLLKYCGNASVIPHLEARLTDGDAFVRRTALEALGGLNAVEAIPAIILVLNDRDESTRCQAALVLGCMQADSAVTPLIAILQNDEYSVARQMAANALGEIGNESAICPLADSLQDENALVRVASLAALRQIRDAAGTELNGATLQKMCSENAGTTTVN